MATTILLIMVLWGGGGGCYRYDSSLSPKMNTLMQWYSLGSNFARTTTVRGTYTYTQLRIKYECIHAFPVQLSLHIISMKEEVRIHMVILNIAPFCCSMEAAWAAPQMQYAW